MDVSCCEWSALDIGSSCDSVGETSRVKASNAVFVDHFVVVVVVYWAASSWFFDEAGCATVYHEVAKVVWGATDPDDTSSRVVGPSVDDVDVVG